MDLAFAKDLKLPTAVATQAIAVLGIRGSGKTNTAGVLAEELLEIGQPVVVVDPTDAWWGLRSSGNGKSPGFPILICGGDHGDLPLAEGDGKALAEFLVAEQVSAILSVRHLRKEAQRRFFVALAEELYHLKGKAENRSSLTLIIDEASAFVPQDVRGDVARSAGAVEDIVNRGRSSGFGVVMINQRAATLNKNVLTQCDTLVIHRMPSPQDRTAIMEWVKENASDELAAEVIGSLASLKLGESWFWSPALEVCQRVNVRHKWTFDSSRTPKIGEAPRQPKKLAEIDLAALKGKMAESIEVAKANDPKVLRKRIADLESQVDKSAKSVQSNPAAIDKAVAAAVKAREAQLNAQLRLANDRLANAATFLNQLKALATRYVFEPVQLPSFDGHNKSTVSPGNPAAQQHVRTLGHSPNKPPRQPVAGDGQSLSRMQRTFLTALAQHGDGLEKGRLLALTGYSSNGTTSGAFAQFVADGWADVPRPGTLRITDAGMAALGSYEPLPSGAELRQLRLNHPGLSIFERKCLSLLFERYPDAVRKGEILEATGYSSNGATSGSFAKLAKIGWATKAGAGELRAADVFFE